MEEYNLFVIGSGTTRVLADYLQLEIGCAFEERVDLGRVIFDARVLRIDIGIRESNFSNSQGIEFERYDFYIAFRPAAKYLLRNEDFRILYEAFPILLASRISEDLGYECAVVEGLGLLVRNFPAK